MVTNTYTVSPESEQPFLEAMANLRLARFRTGATQWGLFRDREAAGRFVELFVVSSWDEHLRQHRDRLTGTDRAFEKLADSLSNPPPETRHLLGAEVPDDSLR